MGEEKRDRKYLEYKIYFTGIVVSFLALGFTIYTTIRNGYARDMELYVADTVQNLQFPLLFLSAGAIMYFGTMFRAERRKSLILPVVLLLLVGAGGLFVNLYWILSYHSL